ncbi:tRNA 4-thiouridine(8) synthase ThiI [Candidatus Uhrbacteria bacterium]|nr:tRNA 4-thiouridine(8) synthase ThiI [Candidatus Uhrbacteria bacterium]
MGQTAVVIHYHELALKGRNRGAFEDALIFNIKKILSDFKGIKIEKRFGRAIVKGDEIAARKIDIGDALSRVFGIANFYFAAVAPLDIEEIKKEAVLAVGAADGDSFKIETSRSNKKFPLNSMEVSRVVGAAAAAGTEKKVKIKNPDIICSIIIAETECYISCEFHQGIGGLPVGSSGKLLSLLSGGIDSPVASWKMMRRGAEIDFIHFHSYPYTNRSSIEKVKDLAAELAGWQGRGMLYLVPFIDIQKEIMMKAEAKYRVLLYRKFMLRIAEEVARTNGAKALVTGESLGQVASQTIENISSAQAAAKLPILRPLIGENKDDIIEMAKKIGTFEISIRPHEDCCTLFVPKNPATKSRPEDLDREEAKLEVEELVRNAMAKIEKVKLVDSLIL